MDQIATLVCFGSAFVGLIAGYFVGYRSGQVAGELAALKSMQHRHARDVSAHRSSRRPNDDSQAASS
jgi:hypothetical protein